MDNPTQGKLKKIASVSLSTGRRIVTVKQMLALPEYKWIGGENALRHMIFAGTTSRQMNGKPRQTNGMDKFGVIIRIGKSNYRKKLLIDLDAFDAWVDAQRETPLDDPSPVTPKKC